MNKQAIIDFFNENAEHWNDNMITDDSKMNAILDAAGVCKGKSVLDVACGTGVMLKWYLQREVASVRGIDISPRMIEIAAEAYGDCPGVAFDCLDAESDAIDGTYDCIVVFNAFPHFISPKALLANLYAATANGGSVTVAHDRGRKALDAHHSGRASSISSSLMSEAELAELFRSTGLRNVTAHATDEIYIVTGIK